MIATRSPSRDAAINRAANDLAYLLRLARIYLAHTRPRVCYDCGHLFTVASLTSGRRCVRCAIVGEPVPDDAPGEDCDDHGPSSGDECDKC